MALQCESGTKSLQNYITKLFNKRQRKGLGSEGLVAEEPQMTGKFEDS